MATEKISRIENIQIPVRDLEQSIRWYEQILGFKVEGRGNEDLVFMSIESGNHINLWRTGTDSTINFRRNGDEMPAFVMVTENMEGLKQDLDAGKVEILGYNR